MSEFVFLENRTNKIIISLTIKKAVIATKMFFLNIKYKITETIENNKNKTLDSPILKCLDIILLLYRCNNIIIE